MKESKLPFYKNFCAGYFSNDLDVKITDDCSGKCSFCKKLKINNIKFSELEGDYKNFVNAQEIFSNITNDPFSNDSVSDKMKNALIKMLDSKFPDKNYGDTV